VKRQAGLTMIEMMIAIVLSSIVAYAGISMFIASSGTASTTSGVGAVTDSGRVALDFIGDSVRGGGAAECTGIDNLPGTIFVSNPNLLPVWNNLNAGATPLQLGYDEAFDGFEAAGTGPLGGTATVAATPVAADPSGADWSTSGGGNLDGLLINQVVKGSDVVAVRESVPQDAAVYTTLPYATGTGKILLNVTSVGNLQPLQYVAISNCRYATVFQISMVDPVGLTLTTNGPIDQNGGDLHNDFLPGSAIAPVDTTVYYIGPGRDTDSSLFSYDEWTGAFQELVPDVENMQVVYGVAAATPNQATNYVTADQVTDFNQVVSVQVALLVASPPGTRAVAQPLAAQTYNLLGTTITAPIDTRLRRVFETTIAVENAIN
jgi:type IV pilus assembly protein PilW